MKHYCTYITSHPSGLFYLGKGITSKVLSGAYQGSGIRFKLALTVQGFEKETWTTKVLEQFDDELEAYEAEARLIPIEALANPLLLNMKAGGLKGSLQTHSRLFRMMQSRQKTQARLVRQAKAKQRREEAASKLQSLKKQLRAQNGRHKSS